MFHHPVDTDTKPKRRPAPSKNRRRLFGTREFVLLALAFLLLALLPSSAQWAWSIPSKAVDTDALIGSAERAEENFSGSAFYFLDPDSDAASQTGPVNREIPVPSGDMAMDQANAAASISGMGAVAQPFYLKPGTTDHGRALQCLTDAIYYEAANEPDAGQRAVAQVIINRMRHPTYPNSICGVIYQGSERATGCQFSYSCDGSMARVPARPAWLRAQRVAAQALAGSVYAPIGMATHYHATYVYPYWAPSLDFIDTIGAHRFYRWKGSAGRPSAFFRSHAGREPFPGPKPRAWNAKTLPNLDPIELQKQYEREFAAARLKAEAEAMTTARAGLMASERNVYADISPGRTARPTAFAAPDYSREALAKGGDTAFGGGNLPGSANVKSEYQQSGSWKKTPSGI
jgi:spore germination cell wall hydrolase CwlJ-like protein